MTNFIYPLLWLGYCQFKVLWRHAVGQFQRLSFIRAKDHRTTLQ